MRDIKRDIRHSRRRLAGAVARGLGRAGCLWSVINQESRYRARYQDRRMQDCRNQCGGQIKSAFLELRSSPRACRVGSRDTNLRLRTQSKERVETQTSEREWHSQSTVTGARETRLKVIQL